MLVAHHIDILFEYNKKFFPLNRGKIPPFKNESGYPKGCPLSFYFKGLSYGYCLPKPLGEKIFGFTSTALPVIFLYISIRILKNTS